MTYTPLQRFGISLRWLRNLAGLTQKELASAVGVSNSYISKIESGTLDRLPSQATTRKIETALDVSINELSHAGRRLDIQALQTLANENHWAFRVLLAMATDEITDQQWLAILDTLGINEGLTMLDKGE